MSAVAAFDFDGTIAKGDSLLPFLLELVGGERLARSVLRHAPALGKVALGRGDRDTTKERFIAHILAGEPSSSIDRLAAQFAKDYLASRTIASTADRIAWHRAEGHELVMVSASLDVYLRPIADQLGFDHLICTSLEVVDGRATGRLVGANVRAAEKARRLQQHLAGSSGEGAVEIWAYGNSSGDHEMLAMATHPFWVDRRGRVRSHVTRSSEDQRGHAHPEVRAEPDPSAGT